MIPVKKRGGGSAGFGGQEWRLPFTCRDSFSLAQSFTLFVSLSISLSPISTYEGTMPFGRNWWALPPFAEGIPMFSSTLGPPSEEVVMAG